MKVDLSGQKFGFLTVERYLGVFPVGKQGKRRGVWSCLCTCGSTKEVFTGDLTSGKTTSCGCKGLYNERGDKKCSRCKVFKPTEEFYSKASACKSCGSLRRKETYCPDRVHRAYKRISEEQMEKRRIYFREKRRKDPEKYNKKLKEWRKANPDYKKNRWKNDLDFRLKENLRGRLYKALIGHSKSKSTSDLVGCSIQSLKKHLESQFTEGMSWENYGEWHVDHIKPCSLFDMSDAAQQRECFNYNNLQPLWAEDNLKKSNNYEE